MGGGIAGLSTAWELARTGRSVAVLEADRIAAGVTGFTTAKVSALHTMVYVRLRGTRGQEGARLYARSQLDAVQHLAEVSRELAVECDLERRPACTWAERPDAVPALRAEARAARDARLPASYVTETGLPFPVAGAVLVEDQAQFHPRKYLLAVAADLPAHGGRVYERTRVTGLTEGAPCRVTTGNGARVTARDVVVATTTRSSTAPCCSRGSRRAGNWWWPRRSPPTATPPGCTSPRSRTPGRCARPRTATTAGGC